MSAHRAPGEGPPRVPAPPALPAIPPGLLEEYLRNARAQLRLLADLADRLAIRADDVSLLDQLRQELHKIHGSAGSYGFLPASRLAAGMEATAKDWLARPADRDVDRALLAHWFVGRVAQEMQLEAPAGGPESAGLPPKPPGGGEAPQVIVVAQDLALAGLLEYGLRWAAYRFAMFRNGREALDALLALDTGREHPLLLLDLDLPGLDGHAVFTALERQRPGTFRVVITTAHREVGESEQPRQIETGALAYVVTPISLRVALEKIRCWVGS